MRAVYFLGNRELEIADIPDPAPGPGEVVLEIRASGMCGSNLRVYRAAIPSPFIAGHEPCGVVAEVGQGVTERDARIGQRVMIHHYTGCGACAHCLDGWSQMCEEGSVVFGRTGDGSHTEYMKVPAYTLVPLPDEMTFSAGAAVSCGTGTAYGRVGTMRSVTRPVPRAVAPASRGGGCSSIEP